MSVKQFKVSRIRLGKAQDGLIELVDFGIMQQQYMQTLLKVETQNTKIEQQLKVVSMKLKAKEDNEKRLLDEMMLIKKALGVVEEVKIRPRVSDVDNNPDSE